MSILAWIIVGLVAGAIARFLLPGDHGGGFFSNLLLGVVGAIVGGFIGRALGFNPNLAFFSWSTWLFAVGGSLVVLVLAGLVRGRR
ncbi:GlsB/YeaQ/YmgE family stress response membrane protein [Brevibacterium sp. 50QC2O2]|jgi:uncharacterized membrane protein YeaQ/YmgE (transglycosylase-associated protein family)|uniref:GlsB/YeaQ/YmgE family stress response membrane protein n=1 Tax=Brevibacterium TaxID=1696 RepID=UPI00211CB59D|nr:MULTISPECIES: GlsB/YeaQ/YmgE family stress response membrane protein [unclassified Brevibacterium]MCQ9368138.1 GlsB/YeaQ/YmgE family stress response membrane protein [Brevibacterium sp. 91QC2O2]MCQ9386043.1 GlsB/YeaQ/YmgE family stress response membrane protein [Brevibacterium sp. 68QC2CO]MCQ9387665.1 GlsB/YeaQ/YmgE family stress response membrane protein [Brevibacterium sp. 50QC2O2]